MNIKLIPLMVNFMIFKDIKNTTVSEILRLVEHLSLNFSAEDILIETTKTYSIFLIDDIDEAIYLREDVRQKLKPYLLPTEITEKILSFKKN